MSYKNYKILLSYFSHSSVNLKDTFLYWLEFLPVGGKSMSRYGRSASSIQLYRLVTIAILLISLSFPVLAAGGALSVSKSLLNLTIAPGFLAQFNLTVQNSGNVSLFNITIMDQFDSSIFNFSSANDTVNSSSGKILFSFNGSSPLNFSSGSSFQLRLNLTALQNISNTSNLLNVTAVDQNGSVINAVSTVFFAVFGDSFEPDNTASQARNISKDGVPQLHNFGIGDDLDFVRFDARQGSIYSIETKNITPFFSKNSTDTVLTIFDDTLSVSNANDDILQGVNFNSRVVFTANKNSTFFVRVSEVAGGATGVYTVSVKEIGRVAVSAFNITASQVAKGFLTSMNATVVCANGVCPGVVVTLDPQPVIDINTGKVQKDKSYLQRLEEGEMVPVIVKLKDMKLAKGVDASLIRAANLRKQESFLAKYISNEFLLSQQFDAVNAIAGMVSEQGYGALLQDSDVVGVYSDVVVHALQNESVGLINASRVHNLSIGNNSVIGRNTAICVIDTGISYNHSDFGNCSLAGLQNNSCAAVTPGFDFVNNDNDPLDDEGHGSHVSGSIVSRDVVFKGVAPGARVTPIKALGASGVGSASNIIAGINWCIANATRFNISVISMSLGDSSAAQGHCDDGNAFSDAINTAVRNGLFVVVASGNDGYGSVANAGVSSPACVSNATAVGSTTKSDAISSFTNRALVLDLLAPGSSITSTLFNSASGHTTISGTSMATPHVAGVAALLVNLAKDGFSRVPSPAALENVLRISGVPIKDTVGTNLSFGRVDAFAAVSAKGDVSTVSGAQPFWSLSSNPQSCGSMLENGTCTVSWTINASGNATAYEFFVIAAHEFDMNISNKVNISIFNPPGNMTLRKSGPGNVNMSGKFVVVINVTNTGMATLQNLSILDIFNASDVSFVSSQIQPLSNGSGVVNFTNVNVSFPANQSFIFNLTFVALNRSASVNSTNNVSATSFDGNITIVVGAGLVVEIRVVNLPPEISSIPIISAQAGTAYVYNVTGFDVNNDSLRFNLTQAPFNMVINASSGRISWVPLFNQSGLVNVSVIVFDPSNLNATQIFTINVSRNNSAPNITTQPILNASEDSIYIYDVNASDLENDSFTFQLVIAPVGMVVNNLTGVINFTPNNSQVGLLNVTVTVLDALNASSNQSFVLNVSNTAPNFTTSALTVANESRLYSYDANTSDEFQGSGALYSIGLGPGGMLVNATTGVLTWTPNTSQVGVSNVSLRFVDGNGAAIDQNFSVTVVRISNISLAAFASPSSLNMSQRFNIVLNLTNNGAKNLSNPILSLSFNASDVLFVVANANVTISNSTFLQWENLSNLSQNASVVINATFLTLNRSNNQSSNFTILASAQDGVIGLQVNATLSVQILFVNFVPVISSTPLILAQSTSSYVYDVVASDGNNDSLTFNLTQAPFNMVINASSGRISWLPLFNQSGLVNVTVVVFDTRGANASQNFTINVSRNNTPPTLTTQPLTNATEDSNYSYDVNASDLENDSISFSLTVFPAGMSINSSTGLVQWVPKNAQVGSNNVTVNVTDGLGNASAQVFVITVANNMPNFTTSPVLNATENLTYLYDVNATDEADGNVSYKLNASPVGMVINNLSGLINWTPNTTQVGLQNVLVIFNDGNGGVIAQAFVISVADLTKPLINVSFPVANAKFNASNVSLVFVASDNFQVASCGRILNGSVVSLFSNGTNTSALVLTSVNGSEGVNILEVFCLDNSGNRNNVSLQFVVDTINPVVIISSPVNGFNTSANIPVIFNVVESNFFNATLIFGSTLISLNQSGSLTLIVPEGINQSFSILANDQLNHSNISTVFFNVDRTPPRVVVPANISVSIFDGRGALVLFNASNVSDNFVIDNLTWDFDSRDGIGSDASGVVVSKNYTIPATFIVTLIASDPAGNQNLSVIKVFVLRDSDGDGIVDFLVNGSSSDTCPLVAEVTNNASVCVGDRDGDGVNDSVDSIGGGVVNIVNNIANLSLVVENQTQNLTNPTNVFGNATVRFVANNLTLVSFPFIFSNSSSLDLSNITMVLDSGAILVKGIVLPAGFTKTLTFPKGNVSHNAVCVIDSQVDALSVVSSSCRGAGEVELNCTSSNAGFTCVDSGNLWSVQGLRNSVVKSFFVVPAPVPSTPPVFTGGGGSGSRRFFDERSGGGVSRERSPPLFEARSVTKSSSADQVQVVVGKKPQSAVKASTGVVPASRLQSGISGSDLNAASADTNGGSIIAFLVASVLIVLIGIAAVLIVWKM